jgi:sec-independent protein translocase protein TatC
MFDPYSTTDAPTSAQGDGATDAIDAPDEQGVMSFLDHLEELRWTLIKALSGILLSVIGCAFFSRWVIDTLLLGPTRSTFFMYDALGINAKDLELLNRTITGQFFADIGTIIVVGLIVGSPVVVYYIWKFIEPALYAHEKSGLRFASIFATFFFMLGISFGYLILTPLALQFFAQYTISDTIVNQFDIMKYFSMVSFWALGTGLLFELPVVIYFLSKVGIVTPDLLRTYRKYALIVVLTIGAFLTPPDPISQIIVALPLLLLYEGSIYISAYVNRRRRKELGMTTE